MNKYVRDMILIFVYGFFVISQLSCSSYFINKKNSIVDILYNYKNISVCHNDSIYRLNDGTLINNILAVLISSCIIIGTFILLIINNFIDNYYSRYGYKPLDGFDNLENSIITNKLMPRDKYDLAIHIIFIMSIICFIVCNGIQFVLQLNNIDDNCLHYIDDKLNNFYVLYKFMLTISFFASYGLFFIIPVFAIN
jgi:hypothetical protein